ncbi:hypothetical protein DdX_10954 [Ditylenchus destructor]|uniref:Uncharacterized protein n=1 Tax=Ditylenchus destructor TaxID=166010 RepID=A0AAD4R511_9BILA|nr:hypothetical protein DdX_10954 [Ditylenchus destructor]
MASAREQLQQLHKAQKRARLPTADDSILEEQLVDEHEEEDSAASDQENRQPFRWMSRDRFVDFSALMEERSSSVSEDSSSQAEEENSRDTVASHVANVPDIHHGPVIQAIQTELGVCHPTLGNFILSLKKVQHGRDQQYMQWISGRRPKDKRKKYKDADKRILKILQEYQRNERTVIELLRGIAQNIVIDDVVGIDDGVENNE